MPRPKNPNPCSYTSVRVYLSDYNDFMEHRMGRKNAADMFRDMLRKQDYGGYGDVHLAPTPKDAATNTVAEPADEPAVEVAEPAAEPATPYVGYEIDADTAEGVTPDLSAEFQQHAILA